MNETDSDSPLPPPESSLRIAGYEGFQRIGSGGFSAVYRARQTSLGRDVAIKVLNADLSTDRDRRTFERECRALGQLAHHPHIVTVHSEAFTADGRPCIVMELYRANYRERLDRDGPLPAEEVIDLGIKIAGALGAAHDAGILHRDLKPHNIFISAYDEPALGDFGISTLDDERSITGSSGLSVAYAAPEVLEDDDAGEASDIYALGATLFHLLEGSAPFASAQLRTSVRRILTEPPPALQRAGGFAGLEDVLHRSLAKSATDRQSSSAAFADELRALRQAPSSSPRGWSAPPRPDGSGSVDDRGARNTEATLLRAESSAVASEAAPPAVAETSRPAPTSTPAPGHAEAVQAGDAAERTLQRSLAVDPSPVAVPGTDSDARSSSRRWIALVLGVTAIAALVGALVLGGGGDPDAALTTTTAVPGPVEPAPGEIGDDVFAQLSVPSAIEAELDAAGEIVVSFDAVDGADRYVVSAVVDTAINTTVNDDGSERIDEETRRTPQEHSCWSVEARSANGASSGRSSPVCATG